MSAAQSWRCVSGRSVQFAVIFVMTMTAAKVVFLPERQSIRKRISPYRSLGAGTLSMVLFEILRIEQGIIARRATQGWSSIALKPSAFQRAARFKPSW
ncbi:hypothetical protein JXA32_06120 [Candidatus Sumerlaeota bacterium]|nr:hypothetical protein [Candidatus Sumerlaeota bacterium]